MIVSKTIYVQLNRKQGRLSPCLKYYVKFNHYNYPSLPLCEKNFLSQAKKYRKKA